jgi:transposase
MSRVMRICLSVERLEQRKRNVAPLVDAFFAYLKYGQGHVAPKMKTGRAISYCINQESFLRVFLTDGAVSMTNNAAEQGIRPFTPGRKDWYLIDAIGGAKSSAISIAETAKANNLKPYEYFKYLLEELPKHGEFEDSSYLDELFPWSEKLPGCCLKKLKSEILTIFVHNTVRLGGFLFDGYRL